jgi:hypothetical protein
VDFNADGDWADPGEQIFANVPLAPGGNPLTFAVPAGAVPGLSFARFRFSTQGGLSYTGLAPDGEVEDYQVTIAQALDFGDAPDPTYPTLLASNGARHTILPGFFLGAAVDSELDGQPNASATGDDLAGIDDEACVEPVETMASLSSHRSCPARRQRSRSSLHSPGAWMPGWTSTATATCVEPVETLGRSGRKDLQQREPDGRLVLSLSKQLGIGTFPVPASAAPGPTFARFRFSSAGGLSYTGLAPDGEVEDYYVIIEEPLDFGDAPDPTYPTLSVSNGARHLISPNLFLGATVDAEFEGQPDPAALGDDNNGSVPDDEDGVLFTTLLVPGSITGVNVTASGVGGLLNAWVDFNRNGSWADPGEQVFTNVPLAPGVNALTFPVPPTASLGNTFARFRFSTQGGLSYTGLAPNGEVEDYQVTIASSTIGDFACVEPVETSGTTPTATASRTWASRAFLM